MKIMNPMMYDEFIEYLKENKVRPYNRYVYLELNFERVNKILLELSSNVEIFNKDKYTPL